jgi:hypothetical protein
MTLISITIIINLVFLALSYLTWAKKTDSPKTPKWLQIKYYTDSHCDIGLTHTVHYPIGQCVSNSKGTYNLLKLTIAADGQVTYHWAHFTDSKCTKVLSNAGKDFVMKMKESECNGIWYKTSAGESFWMREYLFYTKEPPSFTHAGQRYRYYYYVNTYDNLTQSHIHYAISIMIVTFRMTNARYW